MSRIRQRVSEIKWRSELASWAIPEFKRAWHLDQLALFITGGLVLCAGVAYILTRSVIAIYIATALAGLCFMFLGSHIAMADADSIIKRRYILKAETLESVGMENKRGKQDAE